MKRLCLRCGVKCDTDYEFVNKNSEQCVFCDDKDRDVKYVENKKKKVEKKK